MSPNLENSSLWPVTDWSVLGRAADAVGKDAEPLDTLIRRYQKPLRSFLVFKFPWLTDEADQLVIEFAEDRMLKKGWLNNPNSSRGRFRDFLKRSLVNFVLDCHKRKDIQKEALSLDELAQELSSPSAASDSFDLDWTKALLAQTLKRMEDDCRKPGKDQPNRGKIWEVFRIRLLAPLLEDEKTPSYERVVEHLNLRSPNEASNMLLSSKRIFRRHLLAVVSEYEGQTKASEECENLKRLLARNSEDKQCRARPARKSSI